MRREVMPGGRWQRLRFVAVVALSAVAGAGAWRWSHPAAAAEPVKPPARPVAVVDVPVRSVPPSIDVQLGPAEGDLGELTTDAIDRVIETHVEQFKRCYQRGDWPTPMPRRTLHVQLEIDEHGAVTSESHGGLNNPPVGACVTRNIRNLVFPATGVPARVDYPIHFSPAN